MYPYDTLYIEASCSPGGFRGEFAVSFPQADGTFFMDEHVSEEFCDGRSVHAKIIDRSGARFLVELPNGQRVLVSPLTVKLTPVTQEMNPVPDPVRHRRSDLERLLDRYEAQTLLNATMQRTLKEGLMERYDLNLMGLELSFRSVDDTERTLAFLCDTQRQRYYLLRNLDQAIGQIESILILREYRQADEFTASLPDPLSTLSNDPKDVHRNPFTGGDLGDY